MLYQLATEAVIEWIKWSDDVCEINISIVEKMISFATYACEAMWNSLCALRAAKDDDRKQQRQQQQQQNTEHQIFAQSGEERSEKT